MCGFFFFFCGIGYATGSRIPTGTNCTPLQPIYVFTHTKWNFIVCANTSASYLYLLRTVERGTINVTLPFMTNVRSRFSAKFKWKFSFFYLVLTRNYLVRTRNYLVLTRNYLVRTRNYLVLTRKLSRSNKKVSRSNEKLSRSNEKTVSFWRENYLVLTRNYLVLTRNYLVLTRYYLVLTRKYLVLTRKYLVLTRYYLVLTRKLSRSNEKIISF